MERHEERIQLTDSMLDVFRKLSEGNPGALTVLAECYKHCEAISRFNCPPMFLLLFDSAAVYAEKIWMLYNDVCGRNLALTVGCMRAWQMGIVSRESLHRAIETRNREGSIDIEAMKAAVKARLDGFDFDYDPRKAAEPVAANN